MKYFLCLVVLFFLLFSSQVYGQPAVSSVSGTVSHGNSITISGSSFGTKSPAKPLMWDDGESESAGDPPDTSTANSASQVPYSDYRCPASCYSGDAVDSDHQLKYRSSPYSPVSASVSSPHSHSSKFLCGGHEVTPTFGARSVSVTVSTPASFEERWFATWYYRVNPEWPSCASGENHKVTVFQADTVEYSQAPYADEYFYMDLQVKPCSDLGYITVKAHPRACTGGSCEGVDDPNPPWYYNPGACDNDAQVNSPLDGWVRFEQRVGNDLGYIKFLIDNAMAYNGTNNADWYTGSGSYDIGDSGIRSFTVGGYYRYTDTPSNTTHDDAYRLFDDIYVDSTLSRVMLANNSTYDSATIVEPQPPTAWAADEITVTVNAGALSNGTVYLFVFDSDGSVNSTGYSVTLGDAETPSSATTGTAVSGGLLESEVVTGGDTIILTLSNDTWESTVGQDNAITTALIAGIDSAQSEANGWDAVVKADLDYTDVSRDSATQVTVTLPAEAGYSITTNETITVTIPATALVTSGDAVVSSPAITVSNETDATTGISMTYISGGRTMSYNSGGHSFSIETP